MTSPVEGFRQIGTTRINNHDHAVFARAWNPDQLTQEDFIMPDFDTVPAEETIARLRTLAQTQDQTLHRYRRNFASLINELYANEDEDVDRALINAGVPEPRRRYRFTYRVVGTVDREFTGTDESNAWENADPNDFSTSDVDDLEYDDSDSYTDAELVSIEEFAPSDLNDFLNRS